MTSPQRTYSVLVVSSVEKLNTALAAMLPCDRFYPLDFSASTSEARQALDRRPYDLVLINTPLPDDFGFRLAVDVSEGNSAILLIVKSELYEELNQKAAGYGILVLRKPTSTQMFSQAVDWLCAIRERLRRKEKKTASVEEKMEEIRIVNRAKWLLISSAGMTEADAHRTIEKRAMDRCVSKRQIALEILELQK